MAIRVLIAANAFKDSLTAAEACDAIRGGFDAGRGSSEVSFEICPLADGGDSFIDALCLARGGAIRVTTVCDPLGRPIEARWGLMPGNRIAVIEAAAANGLRLLKPPERNPLNTTTAGVGELILAALRESGVERIILGIGGSATNDGGLGMAARLGAKFDPVKEMYFGRDLDGLVSAGLGDSASRLRNVLVDVACDVRNPLCGPVGASAVFGPQKGATPDDVRRLDAGLARFAALLGRLDVAEIPGAGAAGGLGFGLAVFCGGRLAPGCRLVMEALDFEKKIAAADIVLTGEGMLDSQSLFGKVPIEAAAAARRLGKPCVAFVGRKGEGWESCLGAGKLSACYGITDDGTGVEEALRDAPKFLALLAEKAAPEILGLLSAP